MRALTVLAASVVVFATNALSQEFTEPEALEKHADQVSHLAMHEITDAIGEIVAAKDGLRSSPSLVVRVRVDLMKRFPDLHLRNEGTVEDLIKALQDYRARQLRVAAALYGEAATKFGERACQAQKDATKSADQILASNLSRLDPREEARLRQLVIDGRNKALAEDACVRPSPPDNSVANEM